MSLSSMVRSASDTETGMFGDWTSLRLDRRASKTCLNVEAVTEQIRAVLAESDEMKLDTPRDSRVAEYPADEVEAVKFIRQLLRVSQDDVLAAVGVAPRTFHGWRQRGHRPRKASTGALWEATESLFFLKNAHPNLAGWFHASEEARARFAAGDFAWLSDVGLDWAARNSGPPPLHGARVYLDDKFTAQEIRGKRGPALRPTRVRAASLKGLSRRDHD